MHKYDLRTLKDGLALLGDYCEDLEQVFERAVRYGGDVARLEYEGSSGLEQIDMHKSRISVSDRGQKLVSTPIENAPHGSQHIPLYRLASIWTSNKVFYPRSWGGEEDRSYEVLVDSLQPEELGSESAQRGGAVKKSSDPDIPF